MFNWYIYKLEPPSYCRIILKLRKKNYGHTSHPNTNIQH